MEILGERVEVKEFLFFHDSLSLFLFMHFLCSATPKQCYKSKGVSFENGKYLCLCYYIEVLRLHRH